MAADSHVVRQHVQLCDGVVGFAKEMQDFQAHFEALIAKLSCLQSQALESASPKQQTNAQFSLPEVPPLQSRAQEHASSPERLDNSAFATGDLVYLSKAPPPSVLAGDNPCSDEGESATSVAGHARQTSTESADTFEATDSMPQIIHRPSQATVGSGRQSAVAVPEATQNAQLFLDDLWPEAFFQNEKEAEDQLEKIYLAVREESTGNGIIPSGKDLSSTQPKELCSMMILNPTSPIRVVWDAISLIVLIWDAISIPIQVAWNMGASEGTAEYQIFRTALVFWTIDIAVCFFTATYSKSGKLLTSFRGIAMRYASSWLLIDLTIVCLDYIIFLLGDDEASDMQFLWGLRMVRLIRLVKLVKLGRMVDDFCITNGMQTLALVLPFCKIAMQLLAMLHMFGCMFFFVGRISKENGENNWIDTYFKQDPNTVHQYLKSVQFMLCQFSPAPFPWVAQNVYEQAVLLTTILIGIPVIGSNLSRLMALVTQMNAKASESKRTLQELEQYIMVHKFPAELSSKVLHFVMHMVKSKKGSVARPSSLKLLPPDLSVELSLAQVGSALMVHPFVALVMGAKLDIVSDLCTAFNTDSVRPKTEVFKAGNTASCMYITCLGTYTLWCKAEKKASFQPVEESEEIECESPARSGSFHSGHSPMHNVPMERTNSVSPDEVLDEVLFSEAYWFAELALFTRFTHTSTLVPMTFGDIYSIPSVSFQTVVKRSPISTVAAFEYAKALLAKVNDKGDLLSSKDNLPQEMCVSSATSTQLCAAAFPGRDSNPKLVQALALIPQRSPDVHMSSMQEFVFGLLDGKTVDDTSLQKMLPELHATLGTYSAFGHLEERKCCVLSIFSALWLARDNYDAITSVQTADKRLKASTWTNLQSFMGWVGLDEDMLHGALVFLTIRGLGKSKMFNAMCPPPARSCPEYGVAYAMEHMATLVPSVKLLPEHVYHLVESALLLNKDFNLGQLIQGENIPYSVALLEDLVVEKGERLLKFYLFVMVCVMSGLTGKVTLAGSLFLTEQNTVNLLNGVQCLQAVGRKNPEHIYWGYIRKRARQLNLEKSSPEYLTFARLVCLTRTMDSKGLGILQDAWSRLETFDKKSLVNWFTADGLNTQALICSFLPNYFGNAIANPCIGLHFAFLNLLDLLDRLEDYMDKAQAKVYTSDFADFAAMITTVATPQGLCECIKNVKILRKNTRISLVLTNECRQAVAKVAWRRVRDRSRGEVFVDAAAAKKISEANSSTKA